MNEAIRTEALTRNFGNFRALDHLDMKVMEGDCVGFLGPNGAGKTTTIKILTHLMRPSAGKAYIYGNDVGEDVKRAMRDVGAVVETPEFYPYLTPEEILSYMGRLRGMGTAELRHRIDDVLRTVNLYAWKRKKTGTFSKGMKQRLVIAQALIHDPSLLILDEPSSGLDPRGMVEVRNIVKALKKEGKTIFMSSHLLNEVQEVADRVIMIEKGRIIFQDRVDALGKHMKHSTIEISFLTPMEERFAETLKGMDGVESALRLNPTTFKVTLEGGAAERARLLRALIEKGFDIVSYRDSGMALESVYMERIKDSR